MNHTMKQEREINEMFKYAARKERKEVVNYGPDSPVENRRLKRAVWMVIMAIGVILFCLCMIGIVDAVSTEGNW